MEAATEAAALAADCSPGPAQQLQAGGGRASTPPPPPASPIRLDGPQYPCHLSTSAGGSSSFSPHDRSAERLSSLCSPAADSALGLGRGSGLRLQDEALSSPSPISSYGDLASEDASESSLRRCAAGPAPPS